MWALWLGLFLLTGPVMAAEAGVPESVRAAYHASEPPGLLRELRRCMSPSGTVYWLMNATGYQDASVFFDAIGQEIGRVIQPDTGPTTGNFDLSALTGCEIIMKRRI